VRRRIVEMAEAGLSQRAIADRLNANGVPAVGGGWHRGTVIRVLAQEQAEAVSGAPSRRGGGLSGCAQPKA